MATGGVENETLDKDICNCTICLDTFKVPKILPCLHTFCQSCLSTYILSTKGETSPPDYFLCPVCRTEVKPPNPKTPVEEWAQLLPLNQTIATLIDNSSLGEALEEKKCDPCQRDGEVAQAEFWCFECEDGLCQVCHKYHKRMKSFTNHKSVPILDLNKEELQSKMTNIEEPCFEHPGEYLKVYCIDHQKMCCVLCLSIDHRKCENIKTFEQMAESLDETDATQNLAETMKTFGQKIEELIVTKQENIEVIEQEKQDILEDVAKTIEQAKEKLDKCHEDFKIHLSQIHKEQTTKLVETKDRFEIFQKSIANCEKMLQTIMKHGSSKQIFISSIKIKERLEIQLRELQDFLQTDEDVSYDNTIDKHITEMNSFMTSIATMQLKCIVNREQALSVSDLADSSFLFGYRGTLLQRQLRTANIEELEAVKLWDVNGEEKFTDATFLDDDRLLCVDYSNQILKVYDQEGKTFTAQSVDYKPWCVARSSDGKVYVSGDDKHGVRIYTFSQDSLEQIQVIETQYIPLAIAIANTTVLIQNGHSVEILSDGMDNRKNCKCHEYSFIAVSKSDQRSFYCCDECCVVKYTLDGNEIMRCKLQNTKSARGIAIDNSGNIYVCGRGSGNVAILSNDGLSNRIILSKEKHGIFKPYSIGFNHTGTKFFLTGHTNGPVTVFKLDVKTGHNTK